MSNENFEKQWATLVAARHFTSGAAGPAIFPEPPLVALHMHEFWVRIAESLGDRVGGPLSFRLILQPAMALFLAVRAGLNDAKLGKPPYFWALLTDATHRRDMLRDGWKSVGKLFVLAILLDVVYQIIVLHTVHVGAALIVGIVLAIVPYLAVRGPVTRLWSRKLRNDSK